MALTPPQEWEAKLMNDYVEEPEHYIRLAVNEALEAAANDLETIFADTSPNKLVAIGFAERVRAFKHPEPKS